MAEFGRGSTCFEQAKEAAAFLERGLPDGLRSPKVAVICGSGLGGLANTIQEASKVEYEYSSIPHFPLPTGKAPRSHNIMQSPCLLPRQCLDMRVSWFSDISVIIFRQS